MFTVHLGSEQRILNPALRASTGVYLVTSKIMEALVDLDAKGNPAPVLADELGRGARTGRPSRSSCAKA